MLWIGPASEFISGEKGLCCCPETCDKEKKISSQSKGFIIDEEADGGYEMDSF